MKIEINTTTNDIYILDSGYSNSNYKVWKLLNSNSLNNSPFKQGTGVWTSDFNFHNNILYLSGHSSVTARLTKLNVDDLTVLQTQSSNLINYIATNQICFNANNIPIQLSRHYLNQYDTNIKIFLYANGIYSSNLISANFPEIEYLTSGSVASDNFLNKIYFVSSGFNKVFIARFNYPSLSVSNFELSKINIWPNPIENTINLSTEILTGEIYSIEGKKINLNISGKTINVTNLSKGIYILKGTDIYERNFTVKFIKN